MWESRKEQDEVSGGGGVGAWAPRVWERRGTGVLPKTVPCYCCCHHVLCLTWLLLLKQQQCGVCAHTAAIRAILWDCFCCCGTDSVEVGDDFGVLPKSVPLRGAGAPLIYP